MGALSYSPGCLCLSVCCAVRCGAAASDGDERVVASPQASSPQPPLSYADVSFFFFLFFLLLFLSALSPVLFFRHTRPSPPSVMGGAPRLFLAARLGLLVARVSHPAHGE
ncbi:hypothetical protein ACJQWK_01700 [Exserohilum turcicum]